MFFYPILEPKFTKMVVGNNVIVYMLLFLSLLFNLYLWFWNIFKSKSVLIYWQGRYYMSWYVNKICTISLDLLTGQVLSVCWHLEWNEGLDSKNSSRPEQEDRKAGKIREESLHEKRHSNHRKSICLNKRGLYSQI